MKPTIVLLLFAFLVVGCDSSVKNPTLSKPVRVLNDNISEERGSHNLGFDKLSEYGFFLGRINELIPSENVYPYELNTPLFSDYAQKARFISLPMNGVIEYDNEEILRFPVGTTLIKNFYYPVDEGVSDSKIKILETRLLLLNENGWQALEYIWNDEQTEAYLEITGGSVDMAWKDSFGQLKRVSYSMPSINQCKNCHSYKNELRPIGPSARQLNRDNLIAGVPKNQLTFLHEEGKLVSLPSDIPRLAVWNDPSTGSLNQRARAYLDVNCGSCHRPEGSANTSGLFLHAHQEVGYSLGFNKPPVAAGKGSGGLKVDIAPGSADQSILLYRMNSLDPGVMMPEMGRKLVHQEGIDLIEDWIKSLGEQIEEDNIY